MTFQWQFTAFQGARHPGRWSAEAADALGARAFTVLGNDVHLGADRHDAAEAERAAAVASWRAWLDEVEGD